MSGINIPEAKKWKDILGNLAPLPVVKASKGLIIKADTGFRVNWGIFKGKPVLTDQGKVIMAECSHGKGFVFAVGDPWLYNEYIDHDRLPEDFENRKAAENLTDYLLVKSGKRIK
jgi:hypothetical protein